MRFGRRYPQTSAGETLAEVQIPANALYSDLTNGPLPAWLSIARASQKYAISGNGRPTLFASGLAALSDQGLGVHQAFTNSCPDSGNMGAAGWSFSGTITKTTGLFSPDGGLAAAQVMETTSTDEHAISSAAATATVAQWLVEFWAWPIANNIAMVTASGSPNFIKFDLSTGLVTAVDASVISAFCVPGGPGWFRCGFVYTAAAAATNVFCGATDPASSTNVSVGTFAGSASKGVLLWNPTLMLTTLTQPPPPVVSVGASGASVADNVSIIGAMLTALQGSAFTIIIEVSGLQAATVATILGINALVGLGVTAGNALTTAFGGALTTANTATWTAVNRVGLRWNGTQVSICLNGGTIATATQTPPAVTSANLGATSGSSAFVNAYVERVQGYSSALSDADFQKQCNVGWKLN